MTWEKHLSHASWKAILHIVPPVLQVAATCRTRCCRTRKDSWLLRTTCCNLDGNTRRNTFQIATQHCSMTSCNKMSPLTLNRTPNLTSACLVFLLLWVAFCLIKWMVFICCFSFKKILENKVVACCCQSLDLQQMHFFSNYSFIRTPCQYRHFFSLLGVRTNEVRVCVLDFSVFFR